MIFKKYDPDSAAAMFLPHNALYSYNARNQPEDQWVVRLIAYVDAAKILNKAFGPPIQFREWKEVVPIAFSQSLDDDIVVKKAVDKDAWYHRGVSGHEEIYLTSELQMNYLIMAMKDAKIEISR